MPSTIFELSLGFLVHNLWQATLLNIIANLVYTTLSYLIAVKLLKKQITDLLSSYKNYKAMVYFI